MFARCIAIMFSSWLPLVGLALSFDPVHRINVIVSGIVAILFSFGALSSERFRIAAALVGGWVALSSIVLWSSHLEAFVTVTWGVMMFFGMVGPFSAEVQSKGMGPPVPQATIASEEHEEDEHIHHHAA